MSEPRPDTHHKALQINLDALRYGTFAEIGAGQEVARWFFHVGGAAGTVAKTISAYDMTVSDAIYGPAERYVSRKRLQVDARRTNTTCCSAAWTPQRGAETAFFVFADTVATRSYSRPEDGHGWLGIRFQHRARQPALRRSSSTPGCGTRTRSPAGGPGDPGRQPDLRRLLPRQPAARRSIGALMDNLTRDRMEVDMIEFSGPAFAGVDNRLMSLQLVQRRLTNAAVFTASGAVVEAAELLYHKPVLIERGSFRPVTNVTLDMLAARRGADAA